MRVASSGEVRRRSPPTGRTTGRLSLGFWLQLWETFHRFMKTWSETLEAESVFTFPPPPPPHPPAVICAQGKSTRTNQTLLNRRVLSEGLDPTPPAPHPQLEPSMDSEQRPHLSAGQGKCLSHLLQETRGPLEM